MKKRKTDTMPVDDITALREIADKISQIRRDIHNVRHYVDEGKKRLKLWPEGMHDWLQKLDGTLADARSDTMAIASILLNAQVEQIAREDEA